MKDSSLIIIVPQSNGHENSLTSLVPSSHRIKFFDLHMCRGHHGYNVKSFVYKFEKGLLFISSKRIMQ